MTAVAATGTRTNAPRFPGNISQFVTATASFGLDSDLSRGIRLLFQPLLAAWALWSTGAWRAWRARRSSF
ncbi:hypothetical protein [Cryobacterium sp. TMT3-29-2]|uniref:hypothetical protein n=1 Tax=Cryobacterium sp. TMT3-29-2 TaxID=2555867 RepID=UPI0010742D97|nr:hypothetical protein [Cryobacterium sp. TMT3-29-2]TFC91580.1 hypothetical protein E3O67_04510 [Cryobacterium sp. TMT3-29-2]